MALADTGKAIGKITELLRQHLEVITSNSITVGRPEPSSNANSLPQPRLNLFLYEALFDPNLKNTPLDEGQQPPLWLVLKYLITSFDDDGHSDTVEALENLGEGLRALQELSFLSLSTITLPSDILPALQDNPEVLKITFDEAPADLLSKLMQGTDEKYRFSMSFQVRPIMIATAEPPTYSLLVGVDYTTSPPTKIGEEGIRIPVIPSMGPFITKIEPEKFAVNDILTISGSDLHLSGLSIRLGTANLAVSAQRPNKLQCVINGTIAGGGIIAAGSHALSVVQTLPTGRQRSSNLLVGALLPTLSGATASGVVVSSTPPNVVGTIVMNGMLLGREIDDVVVALYQDGQIVKMFDAPFTFTPDQTSLTLPIPDQDAVPPGDYHIILRINGQQAKNSLIVSLAP